MIHITYTGMILFISLCWIASRVMNGIKQNLFDYPTKGEALLNFVGNTTMFVPIGIIWPMVYKKLDTHGKMLFAGVGFSFIIEIIQLLFYDRVTDIDDLLMNSFGFAVGYGIYLLVKTVSSKAKNKSKK